MTAPLVSVERVSLEYPRPQGDAGVLKVLDNVSFDVGEGEFVTVIGPTGCGKTSVLRMVAGLVRGTAGSVKVAGVPVSGPGDIVSFVFQQIALVPWRTVLRNVELALELRNHSRLGPDDKVRAMDMIALVGLEGFHEYYPHQLSGGMQQRVGIARALVTNPGLLLMDEPFGALDAQTKRILQDELVKWRLETDLSILFVTHDLDEAVYLSDRIVVMSARPGRIIESVDVNLPRPRTGYDCRAHPEYERVHARAWKILRAQNIYEIPKPSP